jgi:hypothetical protein
MASTAVVISKLAFCCLHHAQSRSHCKAAAALEEVECCIRKEESLACTLSVICHSGL